MTAQIFLTPPLRWPPGHISILASFIDSQTFNVLYDVSAKKTWLLSCPV